MHLPNASNKILNNVQFFIFFFFEDIHFKINFRHMECFKNDYQDGSIRTSRTSMKYFMVYVFQELLEFFKEYGINSHAVF